jgi:hypothetical protein
MGGWEISVALGVAMFAAWLTGIWMGARLRIKGGKTKPSRFDDASVAVLGLLLAFSFGTSMSKYDQRRLAVVADSNAIGDFYTCATLLKEPTRAKLRSVIKEYAELRLSLTKGRINLEGALIKAEDLHRQMTDLVRQALNDGTPIAVSLTNTLNGVIRNQAARLAAFRDRLPMSVTILLAMASLVATLLIGREQGVTAAREVAGTVCFILLVCLAIFVTLDMNQPDRGFLRTSQESMERLLSSMQQ